MCRWNRKVLIVAFQFLTIFLLSSMTKGILPTVEGASGETFNQRNKRREAHYRKQRNAARKKNKHRVKRPIRPGRFANVDRFDEVYLIIRNTFLIAIAPCVISFLWSLYKDPATPLVVRALWDMFQERMLGLLSVQ
jgi:hypothetical protein